MGKQISAETRAAIAADLTAGMKRQAVADKYDVSYRTVAVIDGSLLSGTFTAERPVTTRRAPQQLTTEQRDALIADYVEGVLSGPQLAKKHRVSSSTVNDIAKKAGVARAGNRSTSESPVVLAAGAWIYGKDGIARWVAGAVPQDKDGAA